MVTQPAGTGKRRMIAGLVGFVVAIVACIVGYRVIFAEMIREFAQAHQTSRVVLFLAIVGLVAGFIAYSLVMNLLERSARLVVERRHDTDASDARAPSDGR